MAWSRDKTWIMASIHSASKVAKSSMTEVVNLSQTGTLRMRKTTGKKLIPAPGAFLKPDAKLEQVDVAQSHKQSMLVVDENRLEVQLQAQRRAPQLVCLPLGF